MTAKIAISILTILALLFAGGCATIQKNDQESAASLVEKYLGEFLHQAIICEDKGDLVAALKQYKLALTVNPSNPEALKGHERIQKALGHSADAHYQKGLSLLQQGKYSAAEKKFLAALRLRPEYPKALKMLIKRERFEIKRYILHKIKPGENLAMVADLYYGDFKKFPLIAKYNQISDANIIKVGDTLKIPEIEGVAFRPSPLGLKTDVQMPPAPSLRDPAEYLWEIEQDNKEDQLVLYLDLGATLFRKQRYQEAILEFEKALRAYPDNAIAVDYLYRLHLQAAGERLDRNEHLAAINQFREALRYNKTCEACRQGILKGEGLYKANHYKKGIQHFGNEQLLVAIAEFEMVMALDPHYKRTASLIKKAKTILKNLEAIRARENKETAH